MPISLDVRPRPLAPLGSGLAAENAGRPARVAAELESEQALGMSRGRGSTRRLALIE